MVFVCGFDLGLCCFGLGFILLLIACITVLVTSSFECSLSCLMI